MLKSAPSTLTPSLPELEVGGDEFQREEGAVCFGARVRRGAVGDDGRRLRLARAAGEPAVGVLVEVEEVQAAEARGREAQRTLARLEDEDQTLPAALDACEHRAHARLALLRLAQRLVDGLRQRLCHHLLFRLARPPRRRRT